MDKLHSGKPSLQSNLSSKLSLHDSYLTIPIETPKMPHSKAQKLGNESDKVIS